MRNRSESAFLIQGFDEMELLFELMDADGRRGCSDAMFQGEEDVGCRAR